MSVRDVRLWSCDVGDCDTIAERTMRRGADEKHEVPPGWISINVNAIRGRHNVPKWLCPPHAQEHIYPMFPEYLTGPSAPDTDQAVTS